MSDVQAKVRIRNKLSEAFEVMVIETRSLGSEWISIRIKKKKKTLNVSLVSDAFEFPDEIWTTEVEVNLYLNLASDME